MNRRVLAGLRVFDLGLTMLDEFVRRILPRRPHHRPIGARRNRDEPTEDADEN